MTRCFAHLLAGLALAVLPHTLAFASAEHDSSGNVEIVVDGVPLQRYGHDGRSYVEALKGREYAIRLRNPYPVRVAVALSVDGLNTIDGRQTTAAAARKWVLGPYQTITIDGWQTSRTEARRFEFTTEAGSYGHALGKTANLGVISAVYFRERRSQIPQESSRGRADERASASRSASLEHPASQAAGKEEKADDEYAATGMGRPAEHVVAQVRLDLEDVPTETVNIRYEFRPQLVRLGIVPRAPVPDSLVRRERAQGFEPGFCPVPRHQQ
jgi:hypothetical protein